MGINFTKTEVSRVRIALSKDDPSDEDYNKLEEETIRKSSSSINIEPPDVEKWKSSTMKAIGY